MPYMRRASVSRRPGVATRSPFLRWVPGGMGDLCDDGEGGYYDCGTPVVTQPVATLPVGPSTTDLLNLSLPPVNPLPATPTPVSTTTPSSSGFNLTNLFNSLTGAAVAGQKIYLSSQAPGLVPGTNAIYNPATGQYYNPTTGQVVNAPGIPGSLFPSGLSTSNMGPILLFGGLAIGAFLLIGAIKH